MSTLTFNAKDLESMTIDELQTVLSKRYKGTYEQQIKGLIMAYWTPVGGKDEGLSEPVIVSPWWAPCV